MSELLGPRSSVGALTLRVRDLDAMTSYYRDAVGLHVLDESEGQVTMGHGTTQALVLARAAELRHAPTGAAGLFHTAFVFPTQAQLAHALQDTATHYPGSFTGSADHLVSEALYFDDPEGNGVEMYWDRPRDMWAWEREHVVMASLPLDPNAFLAEHLDDSGARSEATVVGHVHLKVGDLDTAHQFYVEVLGFEETARLGAGALFVSAGGYHHHVGMNTWHSPGAGPRTPALGLGQLTVTVDDPAELDAVADRLRHADLAPTRAGGTVLVDDPWGNTVRVTAT